MNADNQVLSKIKKLLALSESQNEHESTLAAQRAAELMDRHNITRSMMAFVTGQEETVTQGTIDRGKERLINWKATLCHAASFVTRCKMFSRGPMIMAIGTPSDIQECQEFYQLLVERVESTCEHVWTTVGQFTDTHGKTWKNSFKLGMVNEIKHRLYRESKESLKRLEEGVYMETPSENSTALMVINNKIAKVDQYAKMNLKLKNVSTPSPRSYSAYEHGRQEGRRADLGREKRRRLSNG